MRFYALGVGRGCDDSWKPWAWSQEDCFYALGGGRGLSRLGDFGVSELGEQMAVRAVPFGGGRTLGWWTCQGAKRPLTCVRAFPGFRVSTSALARAR